MKKFILLIDSLVKTFSVIEAGKDIIFNYQDKNRTDAFGKISVGDIILGYFSEPVAQIKCAFEVKEIADSNTLKLIKNIEMADGVNLSDSLSDEVTDKTIIEIDDKTYNTLVGKLVSVDIGILLDSEVDLFVEYINDDKSYTSDELIDILNEMYKNADSGKQSNAVRMFGFKYAESIMACDSTPQKLVDGSNIKSDNYGAEIQKGINMYKSVKSNEYGITFAKSKKADDKDAKPYEFNYSSIKGEGISKIFYGTPGCGKSYYIEHDILGKNKDTKQYEGDYKKENIIRTTFYQDYSNTDFVGQILPKIVKGENGKEDYVEYIFNPGPFTLALIQAISNPEEKVALVVEEINRGNAPAIFGDIFQLLDRDDDYISEYGIVNVNMLDYLNDYKFKVNGEYKRYIFKEIKIPANMYIFATMNTSDQNVYTLDTAFIRRWDRKKIKNSWKEHNIGEMLVPGMEIYTWQGFVDIINNCISDNLDMLQVNEDKQIGAFFVKDSLLIDKYKYIKTDDKEEKKEKTLEEIKAEANDKKEAFAYKVLDYLWSDVTKLEHEIMFDASYKTLDRLIDDFVKKGASVFKNGMFLEKTKQPQEVDSNE